MENIKEMTPEQEKFSKEVEETVDTIVFIEEEEEKDSKIKSAIEKAKSAAGSQGAKYAGIGAGTGLLGMVVGYFAGKKSEAKEYDKLVTNVTQFNQRFVKAVENIETFEMGKIIERNKKKAARRITDNLRAYILTEKMEYTSEEAAEAILILGEKKIKDLSDRDLNALNEETIELLETSGNSEEEAMAFQEGMVAIATETIIRKHVRQMEITEQVIDEINNVKDMEAERENIVAVLYTLANEKQGKFTKIFKRKKQQERELELKEVLISLLELANVFEGIKETLETGIGEIINAETKKLNKEIEEIEKEHKEAIKQMAEQIKETQELNK